MDLLMLWNLIIGLYLLGLIWTIQIVHYPSFLYVDPKRFQDFSRFHQNGMTKVVGLVMIAELLVSFLMVWHQSASLPSLITLGLVVAIWMFTFFVSVPLHNKLLAGMDSEKINKLIRTNWPRTLLWTVKSLLLIYWLGFYGI